jgi:hypothetical protein
MPNNLSEQIREWHEQAVYCAQQADARTDPKVNSSFWSSSGSGCCWRAVATSLNVWAAFTTRRTGNRTTC